MEESRDATNTCTFCWPEDAAGDTAESWPAGDAGNMCKRSWSKALRSPDGKVWRLADLEQHGGRVHETWRREDVCEASQ